EGMDAVAEVTVRIRELGAPQQPNVKGGAQRQPAYSGYGVNTDTLVAAAEAYMGALNKMLAARQERARAEAAAYAAGYDPESPTYAVDMFGMSVLGKGE